MCGVPNPKDALTIKVAMDGQVYKKKIIFDMYKLQNYSKHYYHQQEKKPRNRCILPGALKFGGLNQYINYQSLVLK